MGCECPKCRRPKDCNDELCVMCELKETVVKNVKSIVTKITHKGGNREEG